MAQALEVLGDWWTLLVVREAFAGVRRFADFEANLDISKNVLSARLEHLVAHGVLARVDAGIHGTRYEYELTPMGKDLATVMTALREWGDRWIYGERCEPLLALDRRSGRRIPHLRILDNGGRPLAAAISRWPRGRGRADGRAPASVHLESAEMTLIERRREPDAPYNHESAATRDCSCNGTTE